MDYIQMIQRLQMTYGNKIILISCGAFYIAVGIDAVALNSELNLKVTCAKNGICKVGVPKTSIEKYIEVLDKTGYGYIVFDYDKEKIEITKRYEKDGKRRIINDFNKGCSICENRKFFRLSEYEEALNKYFKKEFGEDTLW